MEVDIITITICILNITEMVGNLPRVTQLISEVVLTPWPKRLAIPHF